jgi:hypothetical protein
MTYTLNFIGKFGLWELQVNRFRARFYRTRDEAMKTVTRYRRMLQSECDREERRTNRERESFAQMRWDSYREIL